jgi:hypothetical protein
MVSLNNSLLWEDPFSNIKYDNKHDCFIEIYLHNHFNDKEKILLNEFGIKNSVFPSNTLFNYSCFIKSFKTRDVELSIRHWIGHVSTHKPSNYDQLIRLICRSLLEVFINNKAHLHTFEYKYGRFDNFMLELILQNPNFICSIKKLVLYSYINDKFIDLIKFLHFNCNSISTFHLNCYNENDNNIYESIEKYLTKLQQKLKKIVFKHHNYT